MAARGGRYHDGELAVQAQAGQRAAAMQVEPGIGATIPPVAARFLAAQPMLAVAARDPAGQVWGSLLTGPPGFLRVVDGRRVAVEARPAADDPLAEVLAAPAWVGTLAIEPGRHRRMRINGRAHPLPGQPGGLMIEADQVYANCPKYIQKRLQVEGGTPDIEPGTARRGTTLTGAQRHLLSTVDTFFIATADDQGNCDMSHRGGNPGFVEVRSPSRLCFPDYQGNAMFMTLGNLAVNPAAGLLVPDWATGDLLHLTGTARVIWHPDLVGRVAGAQGLVEFDITEVVERPGASPLRWGPPEYSRFNPEVGAAPNASSRTAS